MNIFSVLFQAHESLVTSNMDLAALLQGSVKCKKGKPPSTKETKKEAFDRYMKIIYRLPFNIKVSSSSFCHNSILTWSQGKGDLDSNVEVTLLSKRGYKLTPTVRQAIHNVYKSKTFTGKSQS